ncbi:MULTISPECIES: hypothetical protein [Thermodesulfobacterium]|jgi:hypothetical protein|uniref:Uncharacterized protein n=1 Tax=Thermodesulfobacterium commune TaxID=1741 RepID=A0A3B8N5Z8_9BACT|nr:hypothetical protein [Thermodesulfobacterium sp.]HAA83656.1 hypothetical protein [Thermodesulfobacterium commune]MBZ4682393.1 hypothetical protein [Thermodesulfobacterium sp.]MDK2861545.1 hypothetical protein [Thermodesulfobacterium sp.]HBT03756.1 hypothetical protein [Thermodesulfobacterium commune]HCE79468.1 hypothetical protein [Thermodesulfobacterium commune]
MKDYKPLFLKLLENKLSRQEFISLSTNIQRILKKTFKTYFDHKTESLFKKYYGSDYLQVLTQEIFLRFLDKKEMIKNLEVIHEKYIFTTAKNLIYYHLTSEFSSVKKEINLEDMKLQNETDLKDKYKVEERLPQYVLDYLENIKAIQIVNVIKKTLSKKELETLCCYIYKHIYQKEVPTNTKKEVHYKRWERIKNKLKNVFEEPFQVEEIPAVKVFEMIKSEICEKIYYK